MTPPCNQVLARGLAGAILAMALLLTTRAEQLPEPEPPQSPQLSEQVYLAALAEAKAAGAILSVRPRFRTILLPSIMRKEGIATRRCCSERR